jgi:hypothetical protein
LGGKFDEHFMVKDYYNDKLYSDILNELIKKSGIVFNKACIEDVLLCKIDTLSAILSKLNDNKIKIKHREQGKKLSLNIMNNFKNNSYTLEFLRRKKIFSDIKILYQGYDESWDVNIEIISISNVEKKCNFGF